MNKYIGKVISCRRQFGKLIINSQGHHTKRMIIVPGNILSKN
jgi:hypothetical protein